MTLLGNSLSAAGHHEDAASVYEARLSVMRRLGASEHSELVMQNNLAGTYRKLGRHGEASDMQKDVYSGYLKLYGEEDRDTLLVGYNYAHGLLTLEHYAEAKSLLRKIMPVARRVLGDSHEQTFRLKWIYADALYVDDGATLDDLREAVTTLVELERTARRVLGSAHPNTVGIDTTLRNARAALRAREPVPPEKRWFDPALGSRGRR